jgi:acyl-CoA thioester hydrolase
MSTILQIHDLAPMITHPIFLRVRYAETDRMGYVYYGNYATYFEVARVETLRTVGITYKSLEDSGILLPVVDFRMRYFAPAHYDDEIRITCAIPEIPSARIRFQYQTHRGETLLNEGETDLAFVDASTGKPMRCPATLKETFEKLFSEN